MERLIYVGRDMRLGYIYVKLYRGLVRGAYLYVKRGRKGMEYFAVLTTRVAKAFSGEVRRRLMEYAADRVERAVKAFLRDVEERIAALASRSSRVYYAFEGLYRRIGGSVAEVDDLSIAEEFLERAEAYIDVEEIWRKTALDFNVGIGLEKALRYAYWR